MTAELDDLAEERRFLLHSLADLEREREAGDVDDADYRALRDGYTSRAAGVLRAIDASAAGAVVGAVASETTGTAATAPGRRQRRLRPAAIALAILLVACGLGVMVARFAAPRGAGDTVSGGTPEDRIAGLLTDGRSAMGAFDYNLATERYREVLDIEPDNVEARAYLGWVLTNAAQQLQGDERAATLAAGRQGLVDATEIDPTYADPFCLLAVIAAQFEADAEAAGRWEQQCTAKNPSSDMQVLVDTYVTPLTG